MYLIFETKCYKRRPSGAWFIIIIIIIVEKQGDYHYQKIRQHSSMAENNNDGTSINDFIEDSATTESNKEQQQQQLHYQDRTSIEDSVTAEDDLQKNDVDDNLALIEKAFDYLTRKTYPPGCSKNDKRVIRRKAEKLEERNGEIFYKKQGGSTVSVTDITAAQHLLKQKHPGVSGLQPTTLQLTRTFDVHRNREFVQCLNVSSNHWINVSTIVCPPGVINVYDSMHLGTSTSLNLNKVIADMMHSDKKAVSIRTVYIPATNGRE